MDNSNLDNNRTSLGIAHVDHTLLDLELVSESDEAGINLDGFQLMAEIDPFSGLVLNVKTYPIS
jgi:hypothetical protein